MRPRLRSVLLNVHTHAGLLCSSYLLIFGLSALNYNHGFGEPARSDVVSWERPLELPDARGDDRAFADRIRDSLGLIGWVTSREVRRDDRDDLHFGLTRPGKEYAIHVLFAEGRISVEETRTGFWSVVNLLHALTELPRAPFMRLWGVYTEICTWVVLLSALTGVYLWARTRRERFVGWLLLTGGSGTSLLLLVYVWWRG
jgi:hypothetical protein